MGRRRVHIALLSVLACSSPVEPDVNYVDSQPVEYRGLLFEAQSSVAGARIITKVSIQNRTSSASVLQVRFLCPVWLAVHGDSVRAKPPVWHSTNLLPCPSGLDTAAVLAGSVRTFAYEANDILGDSLPPGRYFFDAVMDVDGSRFIIMHSGNATLTK